MLMLSLGGGSSLAATRSDATAKKAAGVALSDTLAALPERALRDELAAVKGLGAGWIRVDLSWSRVQNDRDVYDWSALDRVTLEAGTVGLHILATVGDTPPWARRPECRDDPWCAPRDPEEF